MLFPLLEKITITQWGIIVGTITLFLVILNVSGVWYQKKNDISTLPFIKLFSFGIDNILTKVNMYGANSFIAKDLRHERKLIYIDIANVPPKKDNDKSEGKKVSILLEYFDGEDGRYLYKKYFGRWIEMPEHELGKNHTYTNISSNGIPERLGIAYLDYDNSLILLNSEQTDLSSNGMILNPPHLEAGRYVIVASVMGSNLWDIPPFVFEILNEKEEPLKFNIKKNDEEWIKQAAKSNKALWV